MALYACLALPALVLRTNRPQLSVNEFLFYFICSTVDTFPIVVITYFCFSHMSENIIVNIAI